MVVPFRLLIVVAETSIQVAKQYRLDRLCRGSERWVDGDVPPSLDKDVADGGLLTVRCALEMAPTVKASCTNLSVSKCQGLCIGPIQPGQWTSCLHGMNYATVEWKINSSDLDANEFMSTVSKAITVTSMEDGRNFILQSSSPSNSPTQHFRLYFYTPYYQWIDVVSGTVKFTGSTAEARVHSGSASCCPASCPGAPFFGVLICFCPFSDHGKNLLHIHDLKGILEGVRFRMLLFLSPLPISLCLL